MILVARSGHQEKKCVEPWKKWRKNIHFDHVKNVYTGVKICDRLHDPTGVYMVNERDDSTLLKSFINSSLKHCELFCLKPSIFSEICSQTHTHIFKKPQSIYM